MQSLLFSSFSILLALEIVNYHFSPTAMFKITVPKKNASEYNFHFPNRTPVTSREKDRNTPILMVTKTSKSKCFEMYIRCSQSNNFREKRVLKQPQLGYFETKKTGQVNFRKTPALPNKSQQNQNTIGQSELRLSYIPPNVGISNTSITKRRHFHPICTY